MNSDKLFGMFIGFIIGDALGTTLEFKQRDTYPPLTDMIGGGAFNLVAGGWTDDTSLMLATSAALIAEPNYNAELIMQEMYE